MVLFDRSRGRSYQLGQRIAVGGMGEVYDARASGLERRLVVKRMLETAGGDLQLKMMFLREVAVAATLEHPNVVEVVDAGETQGELFLVMEYVDGPSLAELMNLLTRTGQALPVELCIGIVSNVALGLAHAHERAMPDGSPLGIVHRDVAPANVLLSKNGVPKLVDFGLAKLSGHSLTQPGTIRGRAHALAPEQARGDNIDARADIFGLGAILFELVAGSPLYPQESIGTLLFKVADGAYEGIAPRMEGSDPDLIRIVERALAVDPDHRYRSARVLKRELESFRAARGMRVDSRALAQIVGRFWQRILQERQDNMEGGPGELEGAKLVLPAERRESVLTDPGMTVPREVVAEPRVISRKSALDRDTTEPRPLVLDETAADEPVASRRPSGNVRPPAVTSALERHTTDPLPLVEVEENRTPGFVDTPKPKLGATVPDSGPVAVRSAPSRPQNLLANELMSAAGSSSDLHQPMDPKGPLTSALPRPRLRPSSTFAPTGRGWWMYFGAVLLIALLAFWGVWSFDAEPDSAPRVTPRDTGAGTPPDAPPSS